MMVWACFTADVLNYFTLELTDVQGYVCEVNLKKKKKKHINCQTKDELNYSGRP